MKNGQICPNNRLQATQKAGRENGLPKFKLGLRPAFRSPEAGREADA